VVRLSTSVTADRRVADRVMHQRRKGIEARRKFVRPVGAWFSQVGRLHQVYHLWQYPCVSSVYSYPGRLSKDPSAAAQKSRDPQRDARKCLAAGWLGKHRAQGASLVSPFVHLLTWPPDLSTRKDNGCTHFDTATFQPA